MRALIQRVAHASVTVDNNTVAKIEQGFLIFIGIEEQDNEDDLDYLVSKISQLRVFSDSEGKMNLSVKDINGGLLAVSQFTLHAVTKKGNRPSFIKAARPEIAEPLFDEFVNKLENFSEIKVQKGIFGADMKIELLNDGPVTIWMDSKAKEY